MEKNYPRLTLTRKSVKLFSGLLLFFLLLNYQSAKSQCFYVQSILVDACNGAPCPGTATEGQNEMFSFVVGNAALNVSNLTITWPNNPWLGIETNTAITTPLVNALNSTIVSCGWLKQPTGGVLPANSTVLVITSTDMCTAGNSFASLTDTMYVIFQVAGNTSGHFVNYSSTPGTRTLTVTFSPPAACTESVVYDKSLLIDQSGGHSAQDGAGVDYTPGGVATYINRGCQAPYIPITVSTSAPASACSNATPTLTGVITGPATTYSWTSNGTGTVSTPTGTLSGIGASSTTVSPTYSPGAGESGTVTFTLTAHGKCSVSVVTNTVAITINPAPSPTITSSNGVSICNGGSTVLTASGAGTFTWNPGAHVGSTYTVSPASTQIYSVAATNTCGTTNATYTVTVNPKPTYTLASNSYTLCNGSSQTFTVSGANTYTWTPSATLTNANTANPTATPTATTVYSVTGTSALGCVNATPATVTVTINPVPTLTLTASSATVCSSGSATLTASGASTYTWSSSAGAGLSGTSGSSITVTPTSSPATYTVVGTTVAGCQTSTKTTTVTIVATPTIGLTQATFTTCLNAPVTFTASGASTYTWTPTTGMAGSTTATPTVTPSTTTTTVYSVTGTSSGCTSLANTVTLTVNPLPTYSLTSNSYTICNGSSQTFTVSGASTYTWTPAATLTGANTANPTATPTTTTVYSVTGTSASGCSNATPATVTVTVNPKPSYTLTGNAYTICNGGSQTFTVSGASTYTWTPSATLTNANTANPTATPTTTTVYSVTGTSALGCGNATPATVTVTVSAIPTLSLTANNYTICNGASQTFTASGASTYTWTPAATLTGANTANPIASPSTTTIYTVAGTAAGCAPSSPLTLTLTVNPLPTYSLASNSYTICNGSSQTFTVSGASTYTWTPAATLTGANTANPTATPTTTTVYSVTGTSASGCINATPATVTVTVNPKPSYTLAANSYTICNGGSQTFTVSGASTYTWTPSATLTNANTANPTASPTATTVYSVTGTSALGCGNATPATVTVNVTPVPSLSLAANSYSICNGSSQIFTASGASTYTWTPNTTLNNANIANPIANPTTTTIYTVSGTASGCAPSSPLTLTLTVNPLPIISVVPSSTAICSGGGSSTLTASGASTYTWTNAVTLSLPNGSVVTATPTNTATPTVYTVTGTDANNCVNKNTISIIVNPTPTVSVVGGGGNSQTVCGGGLTNAAVSGITFTSTPSGSVNWTNNNVGIGVLSSGTGNIAGYPAPTVTAQTTGIITASSTVAGCTSTNSTQLNYTITINAIPNETGAIINPAGCGLSDGTIIGASGTNGSGNYSYEWNNVGGFVVSSSYTNAAGTYPLQIKDNVTGCIYSQNFTIPNAGAPPAPTVTASATSVCVGGTVTLTAPTVAGVTYNWTPVSGTPATGNTFTITNMPASPNPFTVDVTATSSGCTGVATTTSITINPLPTPAISSSTSQICQGSSTTLSVTPTGAYNYQWGNSSGIIAGATNNTLSVTMADTYTVTVTDNTTNCSASTISNGTITVNPLPTYSLTSSSYTICNGASQAFNVSGASSYTWTPAASLDNANITNPTASPTTTTVYSVTGTDANACTNLTPATVTLNINPLPTYSLSSSSYTICNGASQTFSVSGASSYTWTPASTLDNGNIANPTASPTTMTVYSVTGTDANACTNLIPATVTVNVNPLPTYSLTGNVYTICNGGSQTFSVSGASSYTWTPAATLDNGNIASPTASSTTTTVYSVTGTDANACTNLTPATVTVNVTSVPSLSLTSNSYTICNGASQMFTASGASTYTWSPAATLDNPSIASPTANPTTTTVYTVNGTSSGCAPSPALTVTLTVNATPTISINPLGSNSVICNGASVVITPTGATTYTLNPGNQIGTSFTVNPSNSTTYTIDGTNNVTGCSNAAADAASVPITVNPTPTITINPLGSNSVICNGGSVVITPNGAGTYTLNPGNQTGTSFTVNPTSSITYTIDGTDAITGCFNATADVGLAPITVNPTPTISINPLGSNSVICNGGSVVITPSGAGTYTLNPGNQTGTSFTVNPTSSITYTIDGTNNVTGCSNAAADAASVPINVNPTPTITINPLGSNSVICNGGLVVITPSGAGIYTLNPGNQTGTSFTVSPSSSTTYTIDGTDAITGCSNATADVGLAPITVNSTPTISINPLGNNGVICNGSSIVISPNINPNNTATYTLNPGNQIGTSFTVSPTSSTTYTIDGTDGTTGCSNTTADAGLAPITVNPTPTISIASLGSNSVICSGASVIITPSMNPTSSSSIYTLNPGGQVGTSFNVSPTSSITYTINGIDGTTGCSNSAADASLITIIVNPTPTLNLTGASVDTAKCNQANGGVSNISASNVSGGLAPYNYQWTNTSTGAIVSTSPSFTNQPNGTYSLQVTDANGCVANVTGTVSPTFSVPLLSVTASFITNPSPAVGTIPLAISFSNTSIGAANYTWSFGDGNSSISVSPTNTYTNVGTYSVVLTAINGNCMNTYTLTVIANIPTNIIIPNVFSPNGDGTNDEFFIPNTGIASLNCDIFNRWGQLLYTITAPNQGWDGVTPNGDKAPEGTYMYILEAKGLDGQTFKQQGTLMLVR